jgi:hypothetical protein
MEWAQFYEFYAPAADKGVDGILSTLEKYPHTKGIILIGKVGDTFKVTYFNRPSEWKVFLPHQRRSVVDGYFRFLNVNPDELHVFSLSKDRVEGTYGYDYIADFFQTALKHTGYTLSDEYYDELETDDDLGAWLEVKESEITPLDYSSEDQSLEEFLEEL